MTAYQVAATVVVVLAVAWDVRCRRIPNALTFGAAAAALSVHALYGGLAGLGTAAGGWLVGAAFFFPFFALRGMGAGDVKLLGAVGAWLGPIPVVWVALFSGIAGGLMALAVAAWAGYLREAFTNIWLLLMEWRITGPRPSSALTLADHRGPRLAYAVPVFAGLMVTLWLA